MKRKKTYLRFILILAVCLAFAVGGFFFYKVATPRETELVICATASKKSTVSAFLGYYHKLYPRVKTTVQYIPEGYNTKTGLPSADLEAKRAAALQTLRVELMAGKGPDVFLCELDVYELMDSDFLQPLFPDLMKSAEAGAFADMSQYIQRDKEFHSEDYILPLFAAGQLEGKQYVIPLTCTVPGITVMAQPLAKSGFNETKAAQDFTSFWAELTRCVPPEELANGYIDTATLLLSTKQPAITYPQHEIFLETPAFKERYAAYAQYSETVRAFPKNTSVRMGDYPEEIAAAENGAFMLNGWYGSMLQMELPYLAAAKELESRFLPIPTEDGGAAAVVENYAVVRANSKNKQNAWNFIRLFLSESAQRNEQVEVDGHYYLENSWMRNTYPVHKAAFANSLAESGPSAINGITTATLFGKIVQDWASLPQRITAGKLPTVSDAKICTMLRDDKKTQEQILTEITEALRLYLSE